MPSFVAERMTALSPPPEDPQLEAARIIAESNHAVADAIREATAIFSPAADVVAGMGQRVDALCSFLRRRGPWILGSVPVVLTSIGAITPDAAKGIHALLVAFHLQP